MTSDRPPLVIMGAGGHAKVIIDMLLERDEYRLAGCVTHEPGAAEILGVPVLGDDEALADVYASGVRHAFVAVGNNRVRADRLQHVRALGFTVVTHEAPRPDAKKVIKLPDACSALGVSWTSPYQMLQDLGASFR